MNYRPNELNVAVLRFLGYDSEPYPQENGARLVDEFGVHLASQLAPKVRDLLHALDQLKPDWTVHSSLDAAAQWAREEVRRKHPELDAKALDALEWAFSWWWK